MKHFRKKQHKQYNYKYDTIATFDEQRPMVLLDSPRRGRDVYEDDLSSDENSPPVYKLNTPRPPHPLLRPSPIVRGLSGIPNIKTDSFSPSFSESFSPPITPPPTSPQKPFKSLLDDVPLDNPPIMDPLSNSVPVLEFKNNVNNRLTKSQDMIIEDIPSPPKTPIISPIRSPSPDTFF